MQVTMTPNPDPSSLVTAPPVRRFGLEAQSRPAGGVAVQTGIRAGAAQKAAQDEDNHRG